MSTTTQTWSRRPGASPELCIVCGERPPAKPRRICKPCRSEQVQASKRVDRVPAASKPCRVEGCDQPRDSSPNQVKSYCREHYRLKQREYLAAARRRKGQPIRPMRKPPEGVVIPEDSGWCRECRQVKLLSEFNVCRSKKTGRQNICKMCEYGSYQRRLAADPERVRAQASASRRRNIKRRLYGVTNEEFDAVVAAQGGRCAICRRKKKLGIDHSHFLGHNRGVICTTCNFGLGQVEDDPDRLRAAADYLEADVERALGPGPLPKLPIASWVTE